MCRFRVRVALGWVHQTERARARERKIERQTERERERERTRGRERDRQTERERPGVGSARRGKGTPGLPRMQMRALMGMTACKTK